MNVRKLMWAAIAAFVAVALLAIGISARFSLSNIISEPYTFIEKFLYQWSPALSAVGTVILAISVFSFIYESRRREEREEKQAIHALHDEIFWNLNNIITLRFQISEMLKYMEEHKVAPSAPAPFELLDTRVFDDMRSRGQLHLLEDIRMNIIPCYKLIRDYNLDGQFKPNHMELLSTLYEWLDKGIRDLECKFKFLPHYIKERSKNQETKDTRGKRDLPKINTLTLCVLFLSFAITVLTQQNISQTLRYIAYAYLGGAGMFAIFALFPKHWVQFLQNRIAAFTSYSLAFIAWLFVFSMKWLDGITNPNTTEIERTIISYVGVVFLIVVVVIETSMLVNVKDRQRWWWLGFLMPAAITIFSINAYTNNPAVGISLFGFAIVSLITVFSIRKWKWNPSGVIPYFPSGQE